ncbi:MAG: enoyl-[acyl-carrier-protein] reductase FabK [Oscillospiraceae bacterium]|mgnify:CR=1 FL=1|jgi:enoyl-[acyl-carrier protein] reductase II|nr:enoyl-[acyl-carrier-protein] reductase FabK [Oscillospiraceae bacterium]
MNTQITKLLGAKYPILQGGMAWVANASLAAAVSNGGGVGLIAGGAAPVDVIRQEIHKAKELTHRPFGVNIMLMSDNASDLVQLCIDEKVAVVTTGAGTPGAFIPALKEAGVKVIPVVPSVALAKRAERAGADAVIAEGMESGGHIGELTTMALVPQVCDAVEIPVIAAGGIADGRGMAAAIMLGAQGVQIGTRFLAARECEISQAYKDLVLSAKDTGTVVTGRCTGHPCRGIRSRLTRELLEQEKDGIDPAEFEKLAAGSLRMAVQDGDLERGSFFAGQIAGMVTREQPAAEIIKEIATSAKQLLQNACMIRGIDF